MRSRRLWTFYALALAALTACLLYLARVDHRSVALEPVPLSSLPVEQLSPSFPPEGKKVKAGTRFEIGSVTKSFTTWGLMHIYDKPALIKKPSVKRLDLDKPVSEYLSSTPTFSLLTKWQNITSRELLAMAGGIEDLGSNTLSWEEIIQVAGEQPLLFSPGTNYCYSNPSFMLLGELIQQLTGLNYEQFMQAFVFQQIGMEHSYIHQNTRPRDVATGYEWDDSASTWILPMLRPGSSSFSSGAMVTSADDLAVFLKAAIARRLLKPSAYDLMWTPAPFYAPAPKGPIQWGLGWQVSMSPEYRIYRKDGAIPGYSAQLYIDDLNGVSVAITLNTGGVGGTIERLSAEIAAAVLGLATPINPPGPGQCWANPE